jgi:biuret amidohydrolase
MKMRPLRTAPHELDDFCDASMSALIVYDMQAGVVGQLSDGAAIVERVSALLDAARSAGLPIFHTRHGWVPNRYAGLGQQRRAMVWQNKDDFTQTQPPFAIGSAQWHIVPQLAPRDDEVVIDKITMSCFEGTYLDIVMRDAGITSFIIAGIALEIGIEPSVRQALDLNYIPLVVPDACGSGNAAAHARSLETLAFTGEVFLAASDVLLPRLRAAADTADPT